VLSGNVPEPRAVVLFVRVTVYVRAPEERSRLVESCLTLFSSVVCRRSDRVGAVAAETCGCVIFACAIALHGDVPTVSHDTQNVLQHQQSLVVLWYAG
jgi:hypothetical protein